MGRCRLGVWTGSVGWSVGRCVLPKEGGGGGDQTRKWLHAGHAFVMGSSTEGVLGVLAPLQSSIGQPRHIVMESWDRQNCIGLSGHIVVGRGVAAGGVVVVASGATPSGPAAGTCPAAAASSAPPFGKARGKGKLGLPMAEVFAQWQSAPPALRHPFRECFAPGWPKWDEGGGGCCMSVCVCVKPQVSHMRVLFGPLCGCHGVCRAVRQRALFGLLTQKCALASLVAAHFCRLARSAGSGATSTRRTGRIGMRRQVAWALRVWGILLPSSCAPSCTVVASLDVCFLVVARGRYVGGDHVCVCACLEVVREGWRFGVRAFRCMRV